MQRTKPRSADGLQAAEDDEAISTKAVAVTPVAGEKIASTEMISEAVAVGTSASPAAADVPLPSATRINPRTGKPLTIPQPLSLSPHKMSPIVPEPDLGPTGSQMIREETEEVSVVFLALAGLTASSDHFAPWRRSTGTHQNHLAHLRPA